MSATGEAVGNDRSKTKNVLWNFFGSIVIFFRKLCGCGKFPSCSSFFDQQNIETTRTRTEDEVIEINVEEEFANNLTEQIVDPSISTGVGRQTHVASVESLFQQQETYHQNLFDLIEEDKEFAIQLWIEEQQFWSNRSKDQTVVPISQVQEPSDNLYSVSFDEIDLAHVTLEHTAQSYREQAQQHVTKRNQFYKHAKQCLEANNRQLANYYFQQAREQTQLIEQANNFAAAAFLAENSIRNPRKDTIDLHHLYVKEAIQALDAFLDDEILLLEEEHTDSKFLLIITGRGKHSRDGIPKIKPAVEHRLQQRSLKYYEINPGLLKVQIFKRSYRT